MFALLPRHSVKLMAALTGLALSLPLCAQWKPALPGVAHSGITQIYAGGGAADRIGPGDLLDIRVYNQPQLSSEARVGSNGAINLPFIGAVTVGGQTAEQIQAQLTGSYGRVLLHPIVSVGVLEVNSRHVAVNGEVPHPGVFAYSGRLTLLEAISMAGGMVPGQADPHILLLHTTPAALTHSPNGTPNFHVNSVLQTIDLNHLAQDPNLNRVLHSGDIVEVPRAHRVFITGAVRGNGAVPLRPGMTLNEAISEAGGYATQASTGDVRILRLEPSGARRQIVVDAGAIASNHAPDIPLKPDDIIVVPTSGLKLVGLGILDFFDGAGRWWVQGKALNTVGMY